jgi:hypothetical protein
MKMMILEENVSSQLLNSGEQDVGVREREVAGSGKRERNGIGGPSRQGRFGLSALLSVFSHHVPCTTNPVF